MIVRTVAMLAGIVLLGMIVPATQAQAPLPVTMSVKIAGHGSTAVQVEGTTLPGAVVSVRGGTKVVGDSSEFALKTTLPVHLVAVRGTQLRRVTMGLPDGAQKWLEHLTVAFDLTTMRAGIDGVLTIKSHPPAVVTVEHVQAGTTVKASVTRGAFSFDLPVVHSTNTLDWTLRAGWITWSAPPLNFTVQ